jgi:hypothetical protein
MIKEPQVRFSPWPAWAERGQIRNAHLPGVYLLAQFDGRPPASVNETAREIVYIGEAAEGSLLGRWQQFERAASEGKPGHRGGLAYRDRFGPDTGELYVAAFAPESLSRELRGVFIHYVYARLLWQWASRWDGEPLCNLRQ